MSTNLTKKIMVRIAKAEEGRLTKKLYLSIISIIVPALAFIYITIQLVSSLLDEEILSVFSSFEFDWETVLSGIWTLAMVVWVLVDKLPLAIAGLILLILFVVTKQGIVSSSLHRLQEITKYKEILKAK